MASDLLNALAELDAALSRPVQQLVLPRLVEQLLALPGGRLFGETFWWADTQRGLTFMLYAGGSGLFKYTFPVLLALHFVWKPIAPSIAFEFILLAIVITPAKNLLPRQVITYQSLLFLPPANEPFYTASRSAAGRRSQVNTASSESGP